MVHMEELEERMGRFEQALLAGLIAWQPQLVLLQTIPGIDIMVAAMLLVEISAFPEFYVEPNGSNAVFVRVHELPPSSPSFCPHPQGAGID
jgi:hypothetical protein